MSVTIKVRYMQLMLAAEEMRRISSSIESQSLNIKMGRSQGEFKEEMLQLAANMEAVGRAFAGIVDATATALDNAKVEFMAADDKASGLYKE